MYHYSLIDTSVFTFKETCKSSSEPLRNEKQILETTGRIEELEKLMHCSCLMPVLQIQVNKKQSHIVDNCFNSACSMPLLSGCTLLFFRSYELK